MAFPHYVRHAHLCASRSASYSRLLLSIVAACSVAAAAAAADEAPEEIIVFGRMAHDTTLEIPQSVEVLNRSAIDESASTSVGDVLRFVPGASRDGSALDAFGDLYLIRGFSTNQTVNGIGVDQLNQARDTINIERIEVLKGPASVLYGQLQPGAVINVVTRQPQREWASEGTFSYGRYSDRRATFDVTGPFNEDGAARFRVTGAYDRADSFLEFWNKEHAFISPNVAVDLGEATTLTVEAFHTWTHWDAVFNGNPAEGTVLPNPNGPAPRRRQYTDPSWDGVSRSTSSVDLRLEHRFNDALAGRSVLTWSRRQNSGQELFGLFGWEDTDMRRLARVLLDARSTQDSYSLYNDLSLSFKTGALAHQLITGFDYRHADLDMQRDIGLIDSLDFYAPAFSYTATPAVTVPLDFLSDDTDRPSDAYGVFLQDRVAVTDRLRLIGGIRYSKFDEELHRVTAEGDVEDFEQSPSAWTSQLGVLYSPTPSLALFANRTSSFAPTSGTLVTGEPLDPETGTQYEVGVKTRLADGRLSATAAAFRLTRGDVSVEDRNNPGFQISIGEQEAEGIEVSATAMLTRDWHLYAGYAYTDAKTTKDANSTLVGVRIRNVPEHGAAVRSNYRFQSGPLAALSLGGAASYVGARSGDLTDSFELPSYWQADIHAEYEITPSVAVSAHVDNVTDKRFFTHAFSLYEVWPGTPRTWRFSVIARL